jgi:phosphatidylserine decarboxylase
MGHCIDRRTGLEREDVSYAPRFLGWCYGTAAGWWLTRMLFTRPWVSRLYGWANSLPWSRRKIRPFVTRLGVDISECIKAPEEYASFGEFITREIDLSRRPVEQDPAACVSPVDGRALVYTALEIDRTLQVKHTQLELRALLRDETAARRYAGGTAIVLRLHLADYHHFHFPVDGVPGIPRVIGARLYAMTPYAPHRSVPFLTENVRTTTIIESARFGPVTMMEIGAFTVASIRQTYTPGRRVTRGERKGVFALGGSCIVLLFERNAITPAADLCANTGRDIETYLRMGEAIGWAGASTASEALARGR